MVEFEYMFIIYIMLIFLDSIENMMHFIFSLNILNFL